MLGIDKLVSIGSLREFEMFSTLGDIVDLSSLLRMIRRLNRGLGSNCIPTKGWARTAKAIPIDEMWASLGRKMAWYYVKSWPRRSPKG